jgi:hypothetical protein
MSHPDLFALLRAELDNAAATAAGAHLDGCGACRQELADLSVGHALLSRAVRTVAEPTGTTPALPAMAAMAAVPATPAMPAASPPRRHRRRGRALLVAAAVLGGIGVGAAGTAALVDRGPSTSPTPAAYAAAPLDPVAGSGAGEVEMVATDARHTEMTIRTHDLPSPGAGRFYYAWLLDPTTDKMLPLGQVEAGSTASFAVADALLDAYSAVDVSLEADDGDPAHSPTSVLRGTYAPGERTSRS